MHRFFRDLDILVPGIVAIDRWFPGGVEPEVPRLNTDAPEPPAAGYAAVGRKR